jgi:antitoxin MazE
MQVAKWGNSLAVRIPAALVRQLGLKEGDQIDLVPGDGSVQVHRQRTVEEVLASLRQFRSSLAPGARLTREEANER